LLTCKRMRMGYSTGSYPAVSHTFIQREIAHLRRMGLDIETFGVRRPDDKEIVGKEQVRERDTTHYLLPTSVQTLLWSHLRCLVRRPRRYVATFRLAMAMRPAGLRALQKQLFYFAEAGLLAQQLRKQRIRHLHNHLADSSCTVALLASSMSEATFSFTIHGSYIFFEMKRWSIDLKVERALVVICISEYCRSQVMMFSEPSQWHKLQVVHCGVDPSLYPTVSHQGVGKHLLFIGRLSHGKGLEVLFESMARLRADGLDVELTIVGDGGTRARLEAMAEALGIADCVNFVGFEPEDGVRRRLADADILVLPSFAEDVPVCLMEAMASGLAVVATSVGGVSELVEHGTSGLVVRPGDVRSLTEALSRLVTDACLRQALGIAARQKIERDFDGRSEATKLQAIFSNMTASPSQDHAGAPLPPSSRPER
jgi:colanic acid/amylovoran biosynthesis glycosyltransferase